MTATILFTWSHMGRPYRLVQDDQIAQDYVIEEKSFADGRWKPCGALVMEEAALVKALLERVEEKS